MADAAFDALQAADDLEAAGIDRKQAKAIAAVVRSVQGDLATKTGLLTVKADLRAEISAAEMRQSTRLYAAAFGIGIANTALTVGLLKLLP